MWRSRNDSATYLWALDVGVRAGDREAAFTSLKEVDPLLRWATARRLRRQLRDARLQTGRDDDLSALQFLRLKATGKSEELSLDDTSALADAYAALPPVVPPRKGPWLSTTLAAVALTIGATWGAVGWWLRPFTPQQLEGGTLYAETLPNLARKLAFERDSKSVEASTQQVLSSFERLLGPAGRTAAERVITQTRAASTGNLSNDAEFAWIALNQAARDQRVPFYLEMNLGQSPQGMYIGYSTWYVQRARDLKLGSHRVPAFHLWSLGGVTVPAHLQGYARQRAPGALVFLDSVETTLVQRVLPALPEGEPMILMDETTWRQGHDWARKFAGDAGVLLRRFASASFPQDPALLRVGTLLAERRKLVDEWASVLRGQNLELRIPERLIPEADYLTELENHVPRAQLRRWADLHAELLRPDNLRAFEAFRDYYVQDVERHEAQHRVDFTFHDEGVPEELAAAMRWTGGTVPLGDGSEIGRAREELSATLATIAQTRTSPLLQLLVASTHLVSRGGAGPYWYAGFLSLREMALQLAIDPDATTGRSVTPEESARLLLQVAEHEDGKLRAAATQSFRKLYLRELETLEVVAQSDSPAWRP